MMLHPQIIKQGGIPAFVVLPFSEYEHLQELLEDAEDIAYAEATRSDTHECFPLAVVQRLAEKENPITVFREYREMSQAELARKANVSRQHINQLESGERQGSTRVLKAVAVALHVELDDLV